MRVRVLDEWKSRRVFIFTWVDLVIRLDSRRAEGVLPNLAEILEILRQSRGRRVFLY